MKHRHNDLQAWQPPPPILSLPQALELHRRRKLEYDRQRAAISAATSAATGLAQIAALQPLAGLRSCGAALGGAIAVGLATVTLAVLRALE